MARDDAALGATAGAPTARVIATGRASALADLELRALMGRAELDGALFDVDRLLVGALAAPRPTILSFVNAHAFNLAAREAGFRRNLLASDILLRDGVGMKLGMALQGLAPGPNLNGTDLIPSILRASTGLRLALFGSRAPWIEAAADAVSRLGPQIAAVRDGFAADIASYAQSAREAKADIVLLAMGMPKQEAAAHAIKAALDQPCLVINGGAIADFLAGRFRRAPEALRRAGLEWAWRLGLEPKRLAQRYLRGNPAFLARAAALRLAQLAG